MISVLVIHFGAAAEIHIQRSMDGGSTWEVLPTSSAGNFLLPTGASGSECADSVIPSTSDASTLQQQRRVPFANPGSNPTQQTFLRFINPNSTATRVEVYGIDDDGEPNRSGAISFTLDAEASLQFTAQDMENGNTDKGLTNSFCDGEGKWQLIVRSDASIEVMSLIRAPGGFLTSLNEVVPESGNDRLVYFVNTADEPEQQTFLRILNRSSDSGSVTISAIDDAGNAGASEITFSLTANDAQQMTSQDLENGNTDKGLTGALGDGTGNWRLTITSTLELDVMSLIRLPGGYLTNLSAVAPGSGNSRDLHFVEPADEELRTSSLRVINTSNNVSTITISAVDDDGQIAPAGDVTFSLNPLNAREITIGDLESGTGVTGMLGDGSGRWRMTVSSTDSLEVMSLVETADGFLTNMSRAVPVSGLNHEVLVFNPASNTERRSSLRIVNSGTEQASITIAGIDDAGIAGNSDVTLNLSGGRSIAISAVDLENGNSELGLVGALGDGTGKWRLTVTSDVPVEVQGTLDTPAGFITNLSRATEDESTEQLPSRTHYEENISASLIQGACIVCHVESGIAGDSALVYQRSTVEGYLETNYQLLYDYVSNGNGETLLNKATGVSHGGGQQVAADSSEYENLSTFVDLTEAETSPVDDGSGSSDPNSDIQATMALPELNCTSSSCHDATPGSARVNLLTGSLEDFVTRLVDQPSGSPSCSTEKLIDSADRDNSLLLKLIDPNSGEQCIGKMPFGGSGVSTEQLSLFEEWVDQLIENSNGQTTPDEVSVVEPIDGFSALSRAKYVLHGGAVTDGDYALAIDNQGDLDVDGLRTAISSWFDTPAFERKMLSFLGAAFHQNEHGPIVPEYFEQLGVGWGQDFCTERPEGLYRHDAMEVTLTEIVPRTAYRLIENDLDFRTIASTNQIVTNSIGLFAFALGDNQLPENVNRIDAGYNLCQYADLQLEDFTDWRMVEMTSSSTAATFEPLSESFVNSLRAIPEGGSFPLKANRNGICNSFSFFANFPTNESNQFRLNVSQCMIASLGHIFEAGDSTPTNSLDGLDESHIDPTTECFGCHQHLDPMTNVYRGQYSLNHRLLESPPADNDGDFSFQGYSQEVATMEDFNRAIERHPDFSAGIAVKLCQWATSQVCSIDDPKLQAVVADFEASGYRFKELVLSLFTSPLMTTMNQSGDYAEIGSSISTTRAQHMCLALETRMEQQLATDRQDDSQPDPKLCEADYYSQQASGTIPRDLFQRGYPEFIQASSINLITPKLFEPLCDSIRHPVMQAFDGYHSDRSSETLDGFTKYIVGIPESSERYVSARQNLQEMYDLAIAPSCGSTSALEQSLNGDQSCGFSMDHNTAMNFVFRNVCIAPATTAIGL